MIVRVHYYELDALLLITITSNTYLFNIHTNTSPLILLSTIIITSSISYINNSFHYSKMEIIHFHISLLSYLSTCYNNHIYQLIQSNIHYPNRNIT